MLYFITDYFTDEIIDVTCDFEKAIAICKMHEGSQVETENDDIMYCNVELPF